MFATTEAKMIAGALLILILALSFGLYSLHLISAGKAEANSVIEKERAVAIAKADAQTATWKATLDSATVAHQKEIDALSTQFVSAPLSPPVVRYVPSPSGVPTSTEPPASPGSAPSGNTCSGVLPETSDELQAEFTDARSSDILIADYRLLYNSWPQSTSSK